MTNAISNYLEATVNYTAVKAEAKATTAQMERREGRTLYFELTATASNAYSEARCNIVNEAITHIIETHNELDKDASDFVELLNDIENGNISALSPELDKFVELYIAYVS